MGMFDEIRCERPLPAPDAQDLLYQTKDTPEQYMEQYVIRPDGSLWHELYDVEDHSDPKAEGLMALAGCMTRVNQRWERCDMTGEVSFYQGGGSNSGNSWWLEFSAYFKDGQLQQLNLISDTRPKAAATEKPLAG